MTRSLGTRVALLISGVLLVMMLLVSLWVDRQLTRSIIEEETQQAQDQARALLTSFKTLMLNGNGNLARQWLNTLRDSNGITDVEMVRRNGVLAFYDTSTLESVNRYLDRNVFKRRALPVRDTQMQGISAEVINLALKTEQMVFDVRGVDSVAVVIPIPYEEECGTCHGYEKANIRGAFAITISSATAAHRITSMRNQLWILMGILTSVLGLVLLWMMRRSVIRPVCMLSTAINLAAQGDRAAKISYESDDELGDVAKAFNRMQGLLEVSELRIRAVMDNVADGIIIANKDLTIEVLNPAISRIFGYAPEDIVGKPIFVLLSDDKRFVQNELSLNEYFRSGLESLHGNIREEYGRRKNGSVFPMELVISEMRLVGMNYYILNVRDITRRIEQTAALRYQAMHDALTGLPNRSLLNDRLSQAISSSQREKRSFALLLMDLDHFKPINDNLGHHVGDQILQHVANQTQSVLRKTDTVARLGGDEFAILLPGTDEQAARQMAEKMILAIQQPAFADSGEVVVGASIGIALYPRHGVDEDALLRSADAAMYSAKRSESGYALYDLEFKPQASVQNAMLQQFDADLMAGRIDIMLQPQRELDSQRVCGFELIARWQQGPETLLLGDELLNFAERHHRAVIMTEWIISQLTANHAAVEILKHGTEIGINVSLSMLQHKTFIARMHEQLHAVNCEISAIVLELSESEYMQDPLLAELLIENLHEQGYSVSLDHFGVAGMSLTQLIRAPIHQIKLDEAYIEDLLTSMLSLTAVKTLSALSQALGKPVIACGVNVREDVDALLALDCHLAQGDAVGPMIDLGQLAEWHEQNLQNRLDDRQVFN